MALWDCQCFLAADMTNTMLQFMNVSFTTFCPSLSWLALLSVPDATARPRPLSTDRPAPIRHPPRCRHIYLFCFLLSSLSFLSLMTTANLYCEYLYCLFVFRGVYLSVNTCQTVLLILTILATLLSLSCPEVLKAVGDVEVRGVNHHSKY
jgi:hypothetical protein